MSRNLKIVIAVLIVLVTILSILTNWSSLHQHHRLSNDVENQNNNFYTSPFKNKNQKQHHKEIDDSELVGDNDNHHEDKIHQSTTNSKCQTSKFNFVTDSSSSSSQLLFGSDFSVAILLKELSMLRYYQEEVHRTMTGKKKNKNSLCSSSSSSSIAVPQEFVSFSKNDDQTRQFIKQLFSIACKAEQEDSVQVDFISSTAKKTGKVSVYQKPDERFFSRRLLMIQRNQKRDGGEEEKEDDDEQFEDDVIFSQETKSLVKSFKSAYMKKFVLMSKSASSFENDFVKKLFSTSSKEYHDLISKTRFSIVIDDQKEDTAAAAESLSTFIPKRFGTDLVQTPVQIIKKSHNNSDVLSITKTDIVISFVSSTSTSGQFLKLQTLLEMIPGTMFIDVVSVTDGASSIDVDAEATASLLSIEYVGIVGDDSEKLSKNKKSVVSRQGFLLSSPASVSAKVFPSVSSSNHHNDIVLDKLLLSSSSSLKKKKKKSEKEQQDNPNTMMMILTPDRWFDVLKEAMATLYLRKYRMKSRVREFDLRRN